MRQLFRLTSCACLLVSASLSRGADTNLLWYDKPATDWEKEALPIGNGRMGAMVFGGVQSERLQISEKSLWTGGPGAEGGYDYGLPAESQAAQVGQVAKQLLDGSTLAPEALARKLGRKMHNYGDYQSFGDLVIESSGTEGEVGGYRRELDLATATARVKYRQSYAGYLRDYFISYPDQALVGRWFSTNSQKLRVRFAVPDNRTAETRIEVGKTGLERISLIPTFTESMEAGQPRRVLRKEKRFKQILTHLEWASEGLPGAPAFKAQGDEIEVYARK